MAGEYYRWLARDVKPPEKRELTPAEKRRNWWEYHKWHLAAGLVCLVMLVSLICDMVRNSGNKPDYVIAYVGTTILPEDTRHALEAAFSRVGEDLNGNGKVQVEITEYLLYEESQSSVNPALQQEAAERDYNASLLLQLNVETVESMIFLLEDPVAFQANYGILTRVDGTRPDETPDSQVPLWYTWTDCPVLTGMELGTFEIPVVDGTATGDSQLAMTNICVARRGLWDDGSNDRIEGALRLWDALTEGAT